MKDNYAHRRQKADVRILKDGKPVANADVKIRMTKHEFLFGCGAFESINMTPPKCEADRNLYKTVTSEEGAAFYRERMEMWLEIFNFGTLPFYWGKFERIEGFPITEQVLEAARWLKERGITLKGHPLCWHTNSAQWLLKYPTDEILRKQLARIRREVEDFRGLIDMWDVINEVVIMPEFDRYDNPVTRICQQLGRAETVRATFDAAREKNPGATLLINDFNTSPKYEALIEECLDKGVKIDVIGIQSHQHQGYWGDEKLYDVLERFSRFGLPLHFTENTFTSGHIMPAWIDDLNDYQIPSWPSTEEGLARQAADVEHFYRILFSCPQVEAITTWHFQDGAWLGAPAGFVTVENRKKPSFHALKHLIREEWWTNLDARTDAAGTVALEGYRGEYIAEVDGKQIPFTLGKDPTILLNV